ncbi:MULTISPECIES: PilW family protein [Rhodanobacteraceae]|uniref:PilW family protein n=1 Tax=Rhodanobacteraceae TaxID=1775411 RepID=UPI000884D4AA|nr:MULTISPECIES: PilW family protein [Rhodanobacteraceae]SDF14788.1 Tfp pilus assembly protein PilW [Dyella sp. 333MFSha]SKB82861.1 Tfp pilus assembly protein PilW [Luteibacter sp. 22Crub2.1]
MRMTARRSEGFSLVELMISMVLGLIVVAGLVSVLMGSRQAYGLQQGNNFNQENIRFAAARLAWSLRMADFWGGVKPSAIAPTTNRDGIGNSGCTADWVLSVGDSGSHQNGIHGYDGGDKFPISDCVPDQNYVKGSDVVVLRYADTHGYDPEKGADTPRFDSTDPAVVPNQTSIFVVSGVGQQASLLRRDDAVPKSTLPTATGRYVYPYQLEMYYLRPCADPGDDGLCGTNDDGDRDARSPSLVRMRLDATGGLVSEVVVDGIEQLSFEYAAAAGSNPGRFTMASVADWASVTQVRATFVARSTVRDVRMPHSATLLLSPHCAYSVANDGSIDYPEVADTNVCKKAPAGAYGDHPQQYVRSLNTQVVLLRNRVRG